MKHQYKQRNFYIETKADNLHILYSYNTPVGVQYLDKVFFTTQKYSVTTSKQCTQYTYENNLKRYNIPQQTLTDWLQLSYIYNLVDNINYYLAITRGI